MIVHSIIVYKPVIQQSQPGVYEPAGHITQEQLDTLNAAHGLSKGMYVKYRETLVASSIWQIFFVVDVYREVKDITYNYKGKPNTIKIVNLGGSGGYIKRNDVGYDFVPLNDEEIAANITNNDLILHRIKTF